MADNVPIPPAEAGAVNIFNGWNVNLNDIPIDNNGLAAQIHQPQINADVDVVWRPLQPNVDIPINPFAGGPVRDIPFEDNNENYLHIQDMITNIIELMYRYPIEELEIYLRQQDEGEIPYFPLSEDITETLREVHRRFMDMKDFIFECLLDGEPISDSNTARRFVFNMTDDIVADMLDGDHPDGIVLAPLPQVIAHEGPYGPAFRYNLSRNDRDDATYLTHMLIDNDEHHLIHFTKCILTGFKIEMNPDNGEFILIHPPLEYENIFTSDWERIELYLNLYRMNESSFQPTV